MDGYQTAVHLPGQPAQSSTANTAVTPGRQTGAADEHDVEIRGTTDTTDEVRDRANADYEREHADDSWWERITGVLTQNQDGTVDGRVTNETSQDAAILAQGVTTRSAPSIPSANYLMHDHPALQGMVTTGVDPAASQEMSDAWIDVGNGMVERQQDFVNAISASESEWRGTSGDKARTFMADVANYIGKAGQSAQLAGKQESLHSQALSNASNSMPEPIPFDLDRANADLKSTTDPFSYITKYTQYMATYQASEAAHQEAAQVLSSYDKNLGGASTMPAFDTPPQMAGSNPPPPPKEVVPPGGGGDGNGGVGNGGGGSITGGGGGIGTGGSGGSGGGGGGIGGGGGGTGGGGVGGGTGGGIGGGGIGGGGSGSGGGRTPGQSFDPGGAGGLPPGGGGGLNNPNNNPGGMPFTPMGTGFGNVNDESRGGGRYGGGGGPGAGGGRGGGGFGTGAGGGGGAGAGGAGRGFGPGGGAGVGALAAEQAAMGRGGAGGMAGRAGAAGLGGMGGMGAGRGQGGEDEEHQRASFLVEPDPDSTFGTDEMTAPPVIGG